MADEKALFDIKALKARRRHYETVFITSPTLNDQIVKDFLTKISTLISDLKAVILRQDDWGKKRMAYDIEKHAMGHYIYFRYVGTEEVVRAFERALKLDANILRFQTVKLSDVLSDSDIASLVEKAPKEMTTAPSVRGDEEEPYIEAAYS